MSALAERSQLEWVDTHAHLHFSVYEGEVDGVLRRAHDAGITRLLTVGVNSEDSQRAVDVAQRYEGVWAAVGVHPHQADEVPQSIDFLRDLAQQRRVVAIGECGLDYYKSQVAKKDQEYGLRLQIELALELELPLIFHVREAFDDFLRIAADYHHIPGVVHSFSAGPSELEQVLSREWYVALNGIATFTKDTDQQRAMRDIPLERLLLETDCPFLSPAGHRGTRNEPSRIQDIAESIAASRGIELDRLAAQTTANATQLFGLL